MVDDGQHPYLLWPSAAHQSGPPGPKTMIQNPVKDRMKSESVETGLVTNDNNTVMRTFTAFLVWVAAHLCPRARVVAGSFRANRVSLSEKT